MTRSDGGDLGPQNLDPGEADRIAAEALRQPDPTLLARIEIYDTPFGGQRVQSYLKHGMTGAEFASVLRQLAVAFEQGTINRVE